MPPEVLVTEDVALWFLELVVCVKIKQRQLDQRFPDLWTGPLGSEESVSEDPGETSGISAALRGDAVGPVREVPPLPLLAPASGPLPYLRTGGDPVFFYIGDDVPAANPRALGWLLRHHLYTYISLWPR